MRELNGYSEEFYILGNIQATEFLDEQGYWSTTDISVAKRFKNYREASNHYQKHIKNFYDNLYPQQIRITIEML